jgi:integrase/recombinase XerD
VSTLGDVLDEYLAMRRAVGFKLEFAGHVLPRFVSFLDDRGETHITVASALLWASQATSPALAIAPVRVFARYVQAIDPATEVPPVALLATRRQRLTPYRYSEGEVTAMMLAARSLDHELWGATCSTVVGLLWATGMRIGEVLRLDRDDVSLSNGLLTVWLTKFNKSRHVPLSACTVEALSTYDEFRQQCHPAHRTDAFFVTKTGCRLSYPCIYLEFVHLLELTGIPSRPVPRPRMHDLRHSFAVRTLLGWYRDGEDVQALLPRLSTYLGHSEPASTYWYLSAAPELMALAAERLEAAQGPRS